MQNNEQNNVVSMEEARIRLQFQIVKKKNQKNKKREQEYRSKYNEAVKRQFDIVRKK